jgi:acetyltransferase EpsM
MNQRLVIWGAGGHALVVADIVRREQRFQIIGFLDSVNLQRRGEAFGGATVLGGEEQLAALQAQGVRHALIAVGYCGPRMKLAAQARAQGLELATAIHPSSVIAGEVTIGDGSVVMAGAVINPAARVGENVVVNTGALVDHGCLIADGVSISPGAVLGGDVRIGIGTFVGIGAVIREKIRIGAGSVIGAGAVVLHDIPDGVVAYGVPARVVRNVANGERL